MDAAIIGRISQETGIPENFVASTISLFEKGATGPFIVHYRKEITGGLDEAKVRAIQGRMAYYREVYDQRAALLKSLSEQNKLTDELRARIESCFTKPELDDLHHQFRPRRKTRAAEALEKGLEPLAEYFWNQEADAWGVDEHINVSVDPAKGVSSREEALQGVVDIIAEWIWANCDYRKALREMLWSEGFVVSKVVPAKVGQRTKYNMYYDRRESVTTIPSHRVLAIRRGCKEGILISSIEGDTTKPIDYLLGSVIKDRESVFAPILEAAVRESYNRILRTLIETEVRTQLKERADREAIRVFQENLANLLLSPPAGPIVVMGIDWGKGDECCIAVVNEAGTFLEGGRTRFTPGPKPAVRPQLKTQELEQVRTEQQLPVNPSPESGAETAAPVEESAQPSTDSEAAAPDESEAAIVEPASATPADESAAITESASVEPLLAETANPEPVIENQLELSSVTTTNPSEDHPAPETEASVIDSIALAESPAEEHAEQAEPVKPEKGRNLEIEEARKILCSLIRKYNVRAISIGTGTGARELETALRKILSEEGLEEVLIAAVNDAGIAIYSSSRIAREEFPDWSASARCAASLARRLQDPLAELVKIDPKLIGVGQYQHDVDQKELHRGLVQTVQYCVNKVGVNVNSAGEALLRYVSGLNDRIARRIVAYRTAQGPFRSRSDIMSAVGMDETTYQQASAFLRIPDGENALDRTAVHPESYPLVEKMAASLSVGILELIGNRELISSLKLEEFAQETAGMPTLHDIREELLRPGRDPRKTFKIPKFRFDVKEMSDLKPGMALEGTVTNVTNFGAFVDIGVRQDGLVHLSQMSNRFIRDPREAVKVGDVVEVKVISVEPETKRIGLSMKALLPAAQRRRKKHQRRPQKPAANSRVKEAAAAEAGVSSSTASPQESVEKTTSPATRPRPNRHRENQPRHRRRGTSRPEKPKQPEKQEEASPKVPEPSLQEKIAILQSKFRRIN